LPRGRNFLQVGADVSIPAAINAALQTVGDAFGRLDAVVTAAGIIRCAPVISISQTDIEDQIATNLMGTLYTIRAALPLLRASRGAIVTISSTLCHRPISGTAVYVATKGAVEALTRALALELGPELVRVNCIAPATVRSDIWLAAGMSQAAYDDLLAKRGLTNPLGRIGEPCDIAELAAFLLSSRASWLTGACIPADGGSMMGARPT
jgi:3-oxoacyl-[acyl-carrier protein] reductase